MEGEEECLYKHGRIKRGVALNCGTEEMGTDVVDRVGRTEW